MSITQAPKNLPLQLTFAVGTRIDAGDPNRLIIDFSKMKPAKAYDEYLQTSHRSIYDYYKCNLSNSDNRYWISIDLPQSDVKPSAQSGAVALTFTDKKKAIEWEEVMILWTNEESPAGYKFTVEQTLWQTKEFYKRLGLQDTVGDATNVRVTNNVAFIPGGVTGQKILFRRNGLGIS